jgi:hypothetical protein
LLGGRLGGRRLRLRGHRCLLHVQLLLLHSHLLLHGLHIRLLLGGGVLGGVFLLLVMVNGSRRACDNSGHGRCPQ